jgi:hypothetical protein
VRGLSCTYSINDRNVRNKSPVHTALWFNKQDGINNLFYIRQKDSSLSAAFLKYSYQKVKWNGGQCRAGQNISPLHYRWHCPAVIIYRNLWRCSTVIGSRFLRSTILHTLLEKSHKRISSQKHINMCTVACTALSYGISAVQMTQKFELLKM